MIRVLRNSGLLQACAYGTSSTSGSGQQFEPYYEESERVGAQYVSENEIETTGYDDLFERMSRAFIPTTRDERMEKLLKMFVNDFEAHLISRIPITGITVEKFAAKFPQYNVSEMHDIVDSLAERGMLFDFYANDERSIWFPDFIIGWFETVEMKDRDHRLPMKEVATLFNGYIDDVAQYLMHDDPEVLTMRTFVREEAVNQDEVHILPFESIEQTIMDSDLVCMGRCACRKTLVEKGELPTDTDQEVCLSFGLFARPMIDHGVVWECSKEDAIQMIEEQKSLGLPQTGDNTKNCFWICNCDKRTCKIIGGKLNFGMEKVIMPSTFISKLDSKECIGCGICVKKCMVDCIELVDTPTSDDPKKKIAMIEYDQCLGCGVCATVCNQNAIDMIRREEQILIPESFLEKYIRTAWNRGKLHDALFDDLDKSHQKVFRQVFKLIEESPLWMTLKNIEPLKSTFLEMLMDRASKTRNIPF